MDYCKTGMVHSSSILCIHCDNIFSSTFANTRLTFAYCGMHVGIVRTSPSCTAAGCIACYPRHYSPGLCSASHAQVVGSEICHADGYKLAAVAHSSLRQCPVHAPFEAAIIYKFMSACICVSAIVHFKCVSSERSAGKISQYFENIYLQYEVQTDYVFRIIQTISSHSAIQHSAVKRMGSISRTASGWVPCNTGNRG